MSQTEQFLQFVRLPTAAKLMSALVLRVPVAILGRFRLASFSPEIRTD